jgi:2-methylcitrate dehydratase PrpD
MTIAESLADILLRPVDACARERAALHVLDWVGCAVLGSDGEAGRVLRSWALDEGAGPCRALRAGSRNLPTALLLNGALGNEGEMDDVHRTSILHPGPVVVPTAIAVAEREGATSAEMLDAVVRGYEASIRIGAAVGPGHYRFWHNTASCGPFGAAAAAGSLLGLDRRSLVWALGNAGTQSGGLWQMRHEAVMSKQLHNGRAAQSGALSADLAARGFTGPASILEGPQGFFAAMCPDGDARRITSLVDDRWRIFDTSFKPWPACRHAHATIDAALALRDDVAPDQIESVCIKTYADALTFCDRPLPLTPLQAKFSLQHSVAVCLLDGPPSLASFEAPAIVEPRIVALRSRVQVKAAEPYVSAYPEHYGAQLKIRLRDGREMQAAVTDALGDPANPLPRAAIIDKAKTLLGAAGLAPGTIDNLVAAALGLAAGGTLRALAETLP